MILLNKTSHAVLFGGTLLIPLKPTTIDGKLSDVKKMYPGITAMLNSGDIETLTKAAAAEAEKDLAAKTIEELQAYAKEQGIDLGNASTKEDIMAAIEAAK
ncbi:Rho termination factor N-terminal domain-containing protein [uncultured Megasphaera sp.]|uniref:Rho termination factor N-terminal domain-containing protein n=1 Tax=uncultured Megasphaera sp. TaxID=165188 RepID=UPI00266EA9D3|nr:Rho termination factor N-terminal domain-containing protein [uncultured Megasphaera sp.]